MKFRLLLAHLVFTILNCVCGALGADVQQDTHELATTLDVFRDRYFTANGGKDKMLSVHSMRVEAVLTRADGVSGKIVYIKEQPSYMRSIWYGPRGMVLRRGSNGTKSCEMVTLANGQEKGRIADDMPADVFEWVIANPDSCGAKLEMLPVERSERSECYHIAAHFANGKVKDYFVDTTTFSEVRVVETATDGKKKTFLVQAPVKFDGIWFPGTQIELNADGTESNRIEIKDVQLNIGLLPCFFDPPEELLDKNANAAEQPAPVPVKAGTAAESK